MLVLSLLVHSTQVNSNTPHGLLTDAVHSPPSVLTIPSFPIRANTVFAVKCLASKGEDILGDFTLTHPMVSPRMSCTPLRVCAPSHAFQSGLAPSLLLSALLQRAKIFLVTSKSLRHIPCCQGCRALPSKCVHHHKPPNPG